MIIRGQESFNFINFDNVKTIGIESHGKKFRVVARTTKNDEPVGIALAEYSSVNYAKRELKRFYEAYRSGDKTFMFRGDRATEFLFYDVNDNTASALLEIFKQIALEPERFAEMVLKIVNTAPESEPEKEKNGC